MVTKTSKIQHEIVRWRRGTKEELRNKWNQLAIIVPCSICVLVLPDEGGALAALLLVVVAFAGIMVGRKEWGRGRKSFGLVWFVLSALLFLSSAGAGMEYGKCERSAGSQEQIQTCSQTVTSFSQAAEKLVLMVLGSVVLTTLNRASQTNQLPGSQFVSQHVKRRETVRPERWYAKEREFEFFVLDEFSRAQIGERLQYEWVCQVTERTPEAQNIETNYRRVCVELLAIASWHTIYELVELGFPKLGHLHIDQFECRINDYLRDNKIGWKLTTGIWTKTGDETGEQIVSEAVSASYSMGLTESAENIRTARVLSQSVGQGNDKDAISKAIRALEGVLQETQGRRGQALNQIPLPDSRQGHSELNKVMRKLYSYASQVARHASEGVDIGKGEAALVVTVCAGLMQYIVEMESE